MVFKPSPKLPTINFGGENMRPGTSSWLTTQDNVQRAFEEYGCFIAEYDQVSQSLHDNVLDVIQPMFELPHQVKVRNSSNLPYHGYYKPEILPLLESFGIQDAPILNKTQSFTNLLWRNGNDKFCETIHSYAKKVSELEQLITKMVFESYGVSKYLDSHLKSTTYLLRVAKYNATQKKEEKIGALAHTDKNFLTILHQNEVDGLEIQTKDGDWITYKSSIQSFVVMAGEPFLAWSNNRIHAPVHRVMMKGDKPRYSFAMFSTTRNTIEVPKELVDEKHPLQFKPFDYMGLLHFYTQDMRRMAMCTINDYCGLKA